MKNGCIVARNIFDPISEQGINAFISALIDGGYRIDKIFFLSDADEREFSQTFAECKNFFENPFVICPKSSQLISRETHRKILKSFFVQIRKIFPVG